jgi:hypothetical protein
VRVRIPALLSAPVVCINQVSSIDPLTNPLASSIYPFVQSVASLIIAGTLRSKKDKGTLPVGIVGLTGEADSTQAVCIIAHQEVILIATYF